MNADREGPRLAALLGQKAEALRVHCSQGLKNSNWTWTDATLEKWLSDPRRHAVPDNNMSFSVPKAEERRDLIAYLKK